MGANIEVEDTGLLEADSDILLQGHFDHMKAQAQYDHGHSGYSGTIAEATGLEIRRDLKFTDRRDIHDQMDSFTEKWGPAVAVLLNGRFVFVGIYSS